MLMKKVIFLLFCIFLFLPFCFLSSAYEKNHEVNLYFFWAEGCPHCSSEKIFLTKIQEEYPELKIHSLEITKNRENSELLKLLGKKLNADVLGVPFTFVGGKYFIGWNSEETTGKAIEEAIRCVNENLCKDAGNNLEGLLKEKDKHSKEKSIPEKIKFPFIGEIQTKNLSLPSLTILIALLDGFNPCAMWVLLFLISLLFGMKNKKRMWTFGIVFLFSSAIVYFLFMAAWLNLFLFLGFIFWIRISIGTIALFAAYYNFKEYFTNSSGACKVAGTKKRQKIFHNLEKIIKEKYFFLALIGLIALAFAVNLVELICSAGLPAVYTQILTLNNLTTFEYYSYLVLYIFVFMLDDLIVFFLAMITLQISGISSKYSRLSHLIGGIVMLIIGILLIFKPELLIF